MKKILTLALALLMMLPLSLVSRAAASAPVSLDISDVLEDNGFAQPGKTYYIPIMYGSYKLETEELERYRFSVTLEVIHSETSSDIGTKKGGSVSLTTINGYRYIKFSSTASAANKGNVTYLVTLNSYDKVDKEWTDPEKTQIEVGYGAGDFCNDSKYTVDNDMPLVEFGDDVTDCLITFPDGSVFAAVLVENTKRNKDDGVLRKINLYSTTTPVQSIENKYPGYDLMYLNFSPATTFKENSILRVYAPGMTYLYMINSYNELTRVNFTRSGDFMVFTTKTLGTYVMSNRELPAVAASNSNPTTTVTPPAAGSALDATQAGSAADSAFASGQTSVRFASVTDVTLDAMQTIASKARARGFYSVVNFDTMNASGGVETRIYFSPGNATRAFSAAARIDDASVGTVKENFGKWFRNRVAVLWLGQQGEYGMTVSVATKLNIAGMDTGRLVFYSYSTATNAYTQISTPSYWIDGAGYLHFNTNVGNYIIVSEGALTKA